MKIHANTHYINTYPDGESILMVKKLAIPHSKSKIINVNLNKKIIFLKSRNRISKGAKIYIPKIETVSNMADIELGTDKLRRLLLP